MEYYDYDNMNRHRNFMQSNYMLLSDPTFINLKLNTTTQLERLENFLTSSQLVKYRDEEGNIYEKRVVKGRPLANEEGVVRILNIVDMAANNHSVQGNTKKDDLDNLTADILIDITKEIISNRYEWGIDERNVESIINKIDTFFRLFLSRTIDNKERESLSTQFQSSEIIKQDEKTGVISGLRGAFK